MSGMMDVDTAAAVSVFADLALKGTVVLGAAWLATVALRRAAASARHLAWAIAFAGLLVLPVLAVALPRWQIAILPAPAALPPLATEPAAPAREAVNADVSKPRPGAVWETAPTPRPAEPVVPAVGEGNGMRDALGGLALLAWIVGAGLALLRLAASVTRVRREARTARRLVSGPAAAMRDRLVWRLGIDRPVVLLEGPAGSMPLTWGIFRPRVLLPAGTEAWPADRLEAVLTHELAHVRRRDCAWQLVSEAACALHWFNPLAWAAARRMRLESEHACDDQVLLTGSRGADYAGHLLDVARTLRPPRAAVLVAVPMARPSQLRTRLHAVLSAERARGPVPVRLAAPALVGAGALLAGIAALTPARAGAAEPLAVVPAPCFVPVPGSSLDEEVDEAGLRTIAWRTGSCAGEARIQGDVRFTSDFTAVRSVAPGGSFRIALRDGARATEVVVRASQGGGVHPAIRVGGRALPWGPEAERWLAAALPALMRITSYGADHRAAAMLARQGAAAVSETDSVRGEAVRTEYADALLGGSMDAGAMQAALDRVATQENYAAVPDLLVRAAPRLPADAGVHEAYLRAAGRIRSAADLRAVLAALARGGGLGQAGWMSLFGQARRIQSGRELEMLLVSLAPVMPADRTLPEEYLEAARRIDGDVERRRALVALVVGRRTDPATQVRVIGETAMLASPAERERMLTQLAGGVSRDLRVESAFRAALRSVDDEARARVLRAWRGDAAPAEAGAVPEDRLNDSTATTILVHEDRTAGDGTDLILLARDVQLTSDRTAIARISADGWVIMREHGATSRRVRITQDGTGALRHEWSGDFAGVDREAWLRRLFTHFSDATRPNRRW